ncbi:hypothetical protein JHJ32_21120 [Parapedobacter sp. ISTM3]|uniref:hypothetical protein n=1 Tax=Parapedobacter sp. ISTM3 TaxID=2800130 RepID=UPI00190779B1|nr:hypothetical protein [Parapedobacter sp. ISTM3]MBK1442514.1 hypothetical protein [Parapedobacter sp. ISTM3]
MNFRFKMPLMLFITASLFQPISAQEVLQNKVLEWTASIWGNGFGHKIYVKDPGNRTLLNIASRHNTAVWTDMLSLTSQGNVGIGTDNPQAKLAVNGNILAKEVKVKTDITVPDYVFAPEYELPTLADVEAYVKEHRHLPEIPSAKDIENNGLDLAEMNLLLLKKVEELTLYLIENEKSARLMKEELADLKQGLSQLKAQKNN